ncbi:domain found in IF2B/IF5-domain-containing protein [Suillus lakei]|nr:domain found in IF2B/IF5-domain-containing protein [Suillus lakei]
MASAGIVNIRRDVDDKFYRYRMPLLLTKIEGKGNGIKTVVPNMADVARALSRPPTYPTKFFGCELGAQTSSDDKNERYIVNGAHDASRLRELLDVFIDKFVLCRSCKNPETDLLILKSGRNEDVVRDCKACGERTDVDMKHKLVTFILKNPPKNPKKSKKGAKGETNGNGGGVHASAPSIPGDENGGSSGGDSDDELTKKIKAEAAELTTETKLAAQDWSADTSPEAVKARVKALESQVGGLSLTPAGGLGDDERHPYAQFGRWVEENKGEAGVGAVQIYQKAQEFGVEKKHKTVLVLIQALFTEDVAKEIDTYKALLAKMVTSEKHQKALLGGIERLVGLTHPELIPSVPKILMALYQIDVLEEDVVTQWGTHVSKKYVDKETSKKVRKASEPFLKWLEDADDDESE